ncbi:MAG TPA: hypothetical protein DCR97_08350, partial [Deltaproteobacteria bacterium]|nr:hypothetical protein [Deltaproteobacteria bacterium]
MTERTEEDLEVSLEQDIEALKAQALENAPQALTLIDLQGKRLWANKAFCQLLGKPLEALLGVSVELAYPLEEQERVKRAIVQETIQKGGIKNFETWFQKDGKKVYVQIHTSLIRDEQGRPNAIVYSAADISAQRSRMEVLLDSLANGVCVADSSGSIHYANPSCAAFMEKPNEVLLQEGWHGLYPPEEREKVAKELARLENEEDPGEEIVSEGVYFLPDGQRRVAKRVLRPIVWEGKQRVLVNISDITELKEAQARLEEEAKYRQEVFERALNGMAVIDPVTLRHFEVNGALAEILGYSKDELLDPQFDFLKVFVPEDAPKVLNALKTALATKASIRYEVSHQRKDGGQRHVLVQISALAPRIGWESERCLVVVSDISDIKHQSDFLEGLFQISPVGLFACDIETGTLLEANPAFLAMLGYSKEEILGKTWYEITPPDVVQRELQENEALLKGEIPMIIREKVFFKKDGTE